MPTVQDKILNHQRIVITGKRAKPIIDLCAKVLRHHGRTFDLISETEETLSNGPIVFIQANGDAASYHPHILLIDEVDQADMQAFSKIADGLPKAGTLVFNKSNAAAKAIGGTSRPDVYLEEVKDGSTEAAAKGILKRIGISESQFLAAF